MKVLRFMVACCLWVAGITALAQQRPAIIPVPTQMAMGAGEWTLKKNASIGCASAQLRPAARYLQEMLAHATGYKLPIVTKGGTLQLALTNEGKEGSYQLSVGKQGVRITGNTYRGVVYGIATLRQLFDPEIESAKVVAGKQWTIPCLTVQDEPRFEWRGMELDCSRHFFSTDEVKKLIDVLSIYKIDKLHWHLTDDQGWRIEIKRYPLLTEKGAWRTYNNQDSVCMRQAVKEDNPNMQIQASKVKRDAQGREIYGGYYSQDDVRDIVAYAKVRGIEIVPEIDMPGHSLMAILNYDGLACFEQKGWGDVFSTPMCPGKDSMLEFCKNVWSELFDLFPSKYVHLGGDEVEMGNWKKCPDCQKRMKDKGLQTEPQLQAWFIHYMEDFFVKNGKEMIGWDEIIEGGLNSNSTVMWWRSWAPNAPKETVSHGNCLICTPNSQFYLDYQEDSKSIPAIYAFDPVANLAPPEQSLVLGVQGNLWTEWVPSVNRMWYQAFPRMLAIAELGWSQTDKMNQEDFYVRLKAHLPRLRKLGVTYRIPDLTGFSNTNVFTDKGKVTVSCIDPSAIVRYTTDGTLPQANSPRYEGTITVDKTTNFIFRTFDESGRKGDYVKCSFIREDFAPAVSASTLSEGLAAEWHDYRGADCAGIEKADVKGTYVVPNVSIPKEATGNIGLIISGYINMPEDGIYTFALLSDDGSYLKLDDMMVVDNDGEHSPREMTGQHAMRRGLHRLYVRYFDHNGGQLKLRVLDAKGNEVKVQYFH